MLKSTSLLNLSRFKFDYISDVLKIKRTYSFTLLPLYDEILAVPNVRFKNHESKTSKVIKSCQCRHLSDLVLNENLKKKNLFSEELIDWAIHCNISHVAFSKLLKILTSNGCTNLPKNSKALLQSREKEIKVSTVPPGVYVHYGIEKSLRKLILVLTEKKLLTSNNIEISVFIDHLPLSKTTNHGLWVILGSIVGFDNTIFLIGAYWGHKIPKNPNLFLDEFVNEAKNLCLSGVEDNERKYNVAIKRIICDAPSRAFILNIKSYSGYSSCTKCDALGEYGDNKICFPEKSNLRSDADFEKTELYKNKKTKLLDIPNFGVVSNMPLDYMHVVCTGVVKKLLSIWIKESKKSKAFKTKIQTQPNEFRYVLKPLTAHKNWTPSQFRQFLLHYGPVVMKGVINKAHYNHFLLLHVACRIFCMDAKEEKLTNFAENMLNTFVQEFRVLYGKEQITLNIHSLYHLADEYKLHGTLDDFSAFPFERYLSQLRYSLKLTKKKSLLQTICKYSQEALFNKNLQKIQSNSFKRRIKLKSIDDEVLAEFNNCSQYERLKIKNSEIIINNENDACVLLRCGKIIQVLHIVEKIEKYKKQLYIGGKEFLCVSSYYEEPIDSSLLDIFRVKNLSEKVNFWEAEMILRKCAKFSADGEEQVVCAMLDQEF